MYHRPGGCCNLQLSLSLRQVVEILFSNYDVNNANLHIMFIQLYIKTCIFCYRKKWQLSCGLWQSSSPLYWCWCQWSGRSDSAYWCWRCGRCYKKRGRNWWRPQAPRILKRRRVAYLQEVDIEEAKWGTEIHVDLIIEKHKRRNLWNIMFSHYNVTKVWIGREIFFFVYQ